MDSDKKYSEKRIETMSQHDLELLLYDLKQAETLYQEEMKSRVNLQNKVEQMSLKLTAKTLEINRLKALLWDLEHNNQ